MATIEVNVSQINCCTRECGIAFWIESDIKSMLISTKRSFYCPNGHGQSFVGESAADKIARLEREKAQILREKNAEIAILKTTQKGRPRKVAKSK